MNFPIFWLLSLLVLFNAGCSDESAPEQKSEQRSGLTQAEIQPSWLDAASKIEPASWLIKHEMSRGRELSVEDADTFRKTLATAAARFKEEPRMIANRAVQLETMLDSKGRKESAVWLISRLTDIVAKPGRVEGFGALGQQYYNLRKAGFGDQDALNDLSERYGPRG